MRDLFTKERFYAGCEDFLYVFQQMASKSMCEAVVEGMGSMWDACATDNRHLGLEAAAEEAVVAWSAPAPWHPDAVPFINHSLNHMFGKDAGGHQKPWNFTRHDNQGKSTNLRGQLGGSLVTKRIQKESQSRLPSSVYDQPAS